MANPFDLWSRATRYPLAASFAISLLVHAALFASWKMFPASFLATKGVLAEVLAKLTQSNRRQEKLINELKQLKNQNLFEEMLRQQEIPLTFIEVDPALAAAQPPKEAKHYSTHDTVASNPNPPRDTAQPKIEGQPTKAIRLFDNPRPQPRPEPQPLQPIFPRKQPDPPAPSIAQTPQQNPVPPRSDAQPNAKSEPAKPLEIPADRTLEKAADKPDLKTPGGETLGDLAKAEPRKIEQPNKVPGSGAPLSANPLITEPSPPPAHERPRTLAQAYAQNPSLAGRRTEQDGGVKRPGRISVDARGSLFGAYDAAFIAAVEERWYQLIDAYQEKGGVLRHAKIVLDFQLRFDGRITDMTVPGKSTEEIQTVLCERAVLDPSPFARWPAEMRRMIGADYREVRFTFYYD